MALYRIIHLKHINEQYKHLMLFETQSHKDINFVLNIHCSNLKLNLKRFFTKHPQDGIDVTFKGPCLMVELLQGLTTLESFIRVY